MLKLLADEFVEIGVCLGHEGAVVADVRGPRRRHPPRLLRRIRRPVVLEENARQLQTDARHLRVSLPHRRGHGRHHRAELVERLGGASLPVTQESEAAAMARGVGMIPPAPPRRRLDGRHEERLRLLQTAGVAEDRPQVEAQHGHVGMIGTQELRAQGQRLAGERLRPGEIPQPAVRDHQVRERVRDQDMLVAESTPAAGQDLTQELARLARVSHPLQQRPQVVERGEDGDVVVGQMTALDGQRLPVQRQCPSGSSATLVEDREVVHA